jgi:hypothetical protein
LEEQIQHAISFLMSLPEEELEALLKELGVDLGTLESGHSFSKPPRFKKP